MEDTPVHGLVPVSAARHLVTPRKSPWCQQEAPGAPRLLPVHLISPALQLTALTL